MLLTRQEHYSETVRAQSGSSVHAPGGALCTRNPRPLSLSGAFMHAPAARTRGRSIHASLSGAFTRFMHDPIAAGAFRISVSPANESSGMAGAF